MAGPNFGILQPIQMDAKPLMGSAPGASAPSVRQGPTLGDEMNGFLDSYAKGLQASTQGEILKQNQLKTEDMQIQAQDRDTLRAAAQEGTDAYRAQLYQQNPVSGVEFDTKMSQMQEQQERVKSVSMDNYKKLVPIQAQFYGNVAGGRNDEERAQIWQMQYKDLPDDVKKTVPQNYSQNDFAAGMLTNQNAIADLAPKKPEAQSTVGKLQNDVSNKRAEINQLKARGMDTTQAEADLKSLTEAEQNQATGVNKFQQANQLRDEVNTKAKPFIDVSDAYGRIKASAEAPSAAGDLAMIFNYMKMLDPGSVVREGEFATAQNAAGIPDRIRNQYNRIMNGERLNPEQRKDFTGQAERLYKSQEKSYQRVVDDYSDRAKRAGLDPKDVIVDIRVPDRGNSQQQAQAIDQAAIQAEMKRRGLI